MPRTTRSRARWLVGGFALAASHCTTPQDSEQLDVTEQAICGSPAPIEYSLAYRPPQVPAVFPLAALGPLAPPDVAPGWFNVATDCPPDDAKLTACLQKRLDRLQYTTALTQQAALRHPLSPIIYFPNRATPYPISATLSAVGIKGMTFVGESRDGVVLRWTGPPAVSPADPAADMFHLNGSSYVHFKRMTLDGSGQAAALVREYTALVKDVNFQATGDTFEDLRLSNAAYGIYAGIFTGATDSGNDHNTIRRVNFSVLGTGFDSEGSNPLNTNIWDSSFDGCGIGVHSGVNINVSNSRFRSSVDKDIWVQGAEDYTILGNTSIGSPLFLLAPGAGAFLVQNNKVDVTSPTAIQLSAPRSAVVIDNLIRIKPKLNPPVPTADPAHAPIMVGDYHATIPGTPAVDVLQPPNVIITGNAFDQPESSAICILRAGWGLQSACAPSVEVANGPLPSGPVPGGIPAGSYAGGGYFYKNTFNSTASVSFPLLVPTPTAKAADFVATTQCTDANGTELDPTAHPLVPPVPPAQPITLDCDEARPLQAMINKAATLPGGHGVVYLPAGVYNIGTTLTFPAGSTVELFGDGEGQGGTVLRWIGQTDRYLFDLPAPARAAIHDLSIVNELSYSGIGADGPNAYTTGRGIHIKSSDDPTGIVYLNQVLASDVGASNAPNVAFDFVDPNHLDGDPTENVGMSFSGLDHLNVVADQSGVAGGDVAIRVRGAGGGAPGMNSVTAVRFYGPTVTGVFKSQYELTNYGNLYLSGVASEGATHGFQLTSERAANPSGRLTLINGRQIGTTWRTPVVIQGGPITPNTVPPAYTDPVQMVIRDFKGEVNLFGINTNMPLSVVPTGPNPTSVMAFGLYYRNQWVWGCPVPLVNDVCPTNELASIRNWWNENGPATAYPTSGISPGVDDLNWPLVSPAPGAIVDCQKYQITPKNNALPSPVPFADWSPGVLGSSYVLAPLVQTPTSAVGLFKVKASATTPVWFLNNSVFNNAGPVACIDVQPHVVGLDPVQAIEKSLVEVRKASLHSLARPCTATVTDARLFRVSINARFTHNGLSVD